jgi:hypothetical protein
MRAFDSLLDTPLPNHLHYLAISVQGFDLAVYASVVQGAPIGAGLLEISSNGL